MIETFKATEQDIVAICSWYGSAKALEFQSISCDPLLYQLLCSITEFPQIYDNFFSFEFASHYGFSV